MATEKDTATPTTKTAAKKQATFPRDMQLVNETVTPYTVGRKYVKGGGKETLHVTSEDHLTRLKTDCAVLVDMNGSYKDADPEKLPLRLEELPATA